MANYVPDKRLKGLKAGARYPDGLTSRVACERHRVRVVFSPARNERRKDFGRLREFQLMPLQVNRDEYGRAHGLITLTLKTAQL